MTGSSTTGSVDQSKHLQNVVFDRRLIISPALPRMIEHTKVAADFLSVVCLLFAMFSPSKREITTPTLRNSS
jgi:hypothetical protein